MKYIVYSKDYCPYCKKAMELLKRKGLDYEEIDVTHNPELFENLKNQTGMMTVPQIFEVDDDGRKRLIGGFDSLSAEFNLI